LELHLMTNFLTRTKNGGAQAKLNIKNVFSAIKSTRDTISIARTNTKQIPPTRFYSLTA